MYYKFTYIIYFTYESITITMFEASLVKIYNYLFHLCENKLTEISHLFFEKFIKSEIN